MSSSRNETFLNRREDTQFDNVHWADNSAKRVLDAFPSEKVYTSL